MYFFRFVILRVLPTPFCDVSPKCLILSCALKRQMKKLNDLIYFFLIKKSRSLSLVLHSLIIACQTELEVTWWPGHTHRR